jgi:hypothetical protein
MSNISTDDGSKNVKNFAAIVYLLVLIFLVGGSYINQHRNDSAMEPAIKNQDIQHTEKSFDFFR